MKKLLGLALIAFGVLAMAVAWESDLGKLFGIGVVVVGLLLTWGAERK